MNNFFFFLELFLIYFIFNIISTRLPDHTGGLRFRRMGAESDIHGILKTKSYA
ncbi:uncharacterized protein BDW43DRAFT_271734 [Aspergillus alliaceus]|uniref:uncharacterized protein n=1 Tax=Petromyces alliaceus TaxID=209559 RepID=UPI0012A42BDC|nr:uncharacterized protein BDW43DRAFT_271734 [Aspergillus alliaceus]KAB8234894.1 hypothetical protein BDW43DRAFT_271734 [Aspergillus alliaceus]